MKRRNFLSVLLPAMLAAWTSASAQTFSGEPRRIGVLTPQNATEPPSLQREPFEQGLRELGWTPGLNVVIEYLYAEGSLERLDAMAADAAAREVDVIIARGTAAAEAAKRATNTIPVVLAVTPDPVRAGLVASLSRPGGNVTGLAFQSQGALEAKQLELLKDGLPNLSRVAVLSNPLRDSDLEGSGGLTLEQAAAALGLQLLRFHVSSTGDLSRVLPMISDARADALLIRADPQIIEPSRRAIIAFALQHRLPTIFPWRLSVEEGGLMSFGPSLDDLHRRSALFVHKIFRGESPANLPIELPTKMELVINMKSAKVIGLTIPHTLLNRADEVIE
jgi:putative ABC transport system substrate-binding protein